LSGNNLSIILCHTAIAASFAMAIIRLRLSDLGKEIEPAAWNAGASPFAAILYVIIPFCRASIIAAFLLAAAVSFDEFMIAWFVGGVNETIPVRVLNLLQGQVNPKINAIGAVVLLVSFCLILLAQRFLSLRVGQKSAELTA
jgi:spermidine/putrescine transport system permease protein